MPPGSDAVAPQLAHHLPAAVKAANFTYQELASAYPHIKQLFDATSMSVFVVQTDDLDLIEDMFSRLNEAVPLNAAEKRNSLGGPLPKIARDISDVLFLKKHVRISNKRYQHRDLATKMLYLSYSEKILDTKKVYLDAFFKTNKSKTEKAFKTKVAQVKKVLAAMSATFTASDKMPRSSGMIVLHYLLFEKALAESWKKMPTRTALAEFENIRTNNRTLAEKDITKADYDLLEFDRLTQTPNDAYAIKFRCDLLEKFLRKK